MFLDHRHSHHHHQECIKTHTKNNFMFHTYTTALITLEYRTNPYFWVSKGQSCLSHGKPLTIFIQFYLRTALTLYVVQSVHTKAVCIEYTSIANLIYFKRPAFYLKPKHASKQCYFIHTYTYTRINKRKKLKNEQDS